ncbi:hypothetical protein N0V82_005587 [Gnomoniopsis sp. IMI 355080]|nr:hypothetical protein N0V82_005587 [Gnomoniopsis sp. IMI 355080]
MKEEAGQELDFVALNEDMSYIPNRHFVLCASTVTFREPGQVLIIRNTKYNEPFYTLPGGRKDIGEALEATAVRETHEETGYHVRLRPVSIPTRATRPRVAERRCRPALPLRGSLATPMGSPLANESSSSDPMPTSKDVIVASGTEPVGMITYKDPTADEPCTKLRFFYYATLKNTSLPPEHPSLDHEERLEAEWMTVADALAKLRFKAERQVVEDVAAMTMVATLQDGGRTTARDREERKDRRLHLRRGGTHIKCAIIMYVNKLRRGN